jgi:hypothetical protein
MATEQHPALIPQEEYQSDIKLWARNTLERADAKRSFLIRIAHYKCKNGKQHEFLLVYVQLPSESITILCLDRTPRPSDRTSSTASPSRPTQDTLSMASSSRVPARDYIIISEGGSEKSIIKSFGPCDRRRTLTFSKKPSLTEFSTLLLATIQDDCRYQLYTRSCYWFAGATWEALRDIFSDAVEKSEGRAFRPSTYRGVAIPQNYGTREIVDRYKTTWQAFQRKTAQEEEQQRRGKDNVRVSSKQCVSPPS